MKLNFTLKKCAIEIISAIPNMKLIINGMKSLIPKIKKKIAIIKVQIGEEVDDSKP